MQIISRSFPFYGTTYGNLRIVYPFVQAYRGDMAGSAPDDCNKESRTNFLVSQYTIKVMFTLCCSLLSVQ
jgi:hypothetical protein